MDIVGTLSIIIDLTWTANLFQNSNGADPGTLRAARVAKLGAKAGRLTRLTKVFKYVSFSRQLKTLKGGGAAKKISAKMEMLLSQRVALLIMTIVILNPFLSTNIIDHSANG